jgi:hypothetical protein
VMEVPEGSSEGGPASSGSSGGPETETGGCDSKGGYSSPSLPACCEEERGWKAGAKGACVPFPSPFFLQMGESSSSSFSFFFFLGWY